MKGNKKAYIRINGYPIEIVDVG